MDTFASSLIALDVSGQALTPCITYADTRSAPELQRLLRKIDLEEFHQLTGTRMHTSYTPARLLWLASEHPEIVAKTAHYLSLGEYVYSRLAGIVGVATSTAAWSGMLDRKTRNLDHSLLDICGVSAGQFGPVLDPDEPIWDVSEAVAKRWPALRGAAWFPAIPDGYASNLGAGATGPGEIAMSAATSGAMRTIVPGIPQELPTGLWSYTVSRHESIVGGALNDVGRVTLWLEATLAAIPIEQVNAILRQPPAESTPLVLPFLTGERSTGWAGNARGAITGLGSSCNADCLWRAFMEGVALSYVRVFEQLRQINPSAQQIVASGGVISRYPGFMDLVGQATGFPIRQVDANRVTMRGAAVLALSVLQPNLPVAQLPLGDVVYPDLDQRPYYQARLEEFEETYQKLINP